MSLWESMKIFFVRRKLLSNKISEDCKNPLEEWMAIKARVTHSKSKELKNKIGEVFPNEITRKEFDEYQLYRFREELRYAIENSPYYRDKFESLSVKPEDIRTMDDLSKIPFTEPSELAESPGYFYALSVTGMTREFTTTGTTGQRKSIGYSTNDLVSKIDIVASALKNIGMKKGDSLHVMFPMVSAWDPSLIMVGACKILGYGSSVCSETDIDVQMKTMKEADSTYIIGIPSFIYRVTMLAGKDLKSLGIKKIICTSEPLSEAMRHSIEDAWGCKVINVWGMTEFGLACAVECDLQNGLHTDEANMLMEIVDPETGKRLPDGETGELIITSLNAEGTPLIRYRTHDIASMISPPCGCGCRFNRKLAKPKGRMDLQFKIGLGTKIFPLLFDETMFSEKDVIDYQLKITRENYKDVLTFQVESKNESSELSEKLVSKLVEIMEISDGLKDDLIEKPRIEYVEIGSLEKSAKAKKIVDARGDYD